MISSKSITIALAFIAIAAIGTSAISAQMTFADKSASDCAIQLEKGGTCIVKSFTRNGDIKNTATININAGSSGSSQNVSKIVGDAVAPVQAKVDALQATVDSQGQTIQGQASEISQLNTNNAAQDATIDELKAQVANLSAVVLTDVTVDNGTGGNATVPPVTNETNTGGNVTEPFPADNQTNTGNTTIPDNGNGTGGNTTVPVVDNGTGNNGTLPTNGTVIEGNATVVIDNGTVLANVTETNSTG